MKRILVLLFSALLFAAQLPAQNADNQVVQTLKGGGLFNVIIACIGIVLFGLLFAIIRLDRKVSKLEKQAK
jgi:type IV secretory pathway VirB2 component (pilin)